MTTGGENRTKVIVAVALMIVAAGSLIWALTRSSAPEPATTAAAAPTTAPATAAVQPARPQPRRGASTPVNDTVDPRLRVDLLKASEDIEYVGRGRNIFKAMPDPPPPVKEVAKIEKPVQPVYVPPPPPPPPPINLKFFGFASRSGESKKVFLSQNDDIFVAAEGDIIKGRYRIVRIMPNAIEVEDVLANNRQSIPLTQS